MITMWIHYSMIEIGSFQYLWRCLFLYLSYELGIIGDGIGLVLLMMWFIFGIHSLENQEIINQRFRKLYNGLFIHSKTVKCDLFIILNIDIESIVSFLKLFLNYC